MNWWLMALAFVLGLVLTGAFMIRRVTREVPVHESGAARPRGAHERNAPAAPTLEAGGATAATAGAAAASKFNAGANAKTTAMRSAATKPELPPGPHGAGSATPNADGSGPAGWTIKGNEESKLYHSTESPSYGVTRAEVWFRDAKTAEAAGFNRWDSGLSQRGR